MAGEVDAQRLAMKRWTQRNSDGKFGWAGEEGGLEPMQAPPAFTEEAHDLPVDAVVLSTPDLDADGTRSGQAIRWVHAYDSQVPTEEPE